MDSGSTITTERASTAGSASAHSISTESPSPPVPVSPQDAQDSAGPTSPSPGLASFHRFRRFLSPFDKANNGRLECSIQNHEASTMRTRTIKLHEYGNNWHEQENTNEIGSQPLTVKSSRFYRQSSKSKTRTPAHPTQPQLQHKRGHNRSTSSASTSTIVRRKKSGELTRSRSRGRLSTSTTTTATGATTTTTTGQASEYDYMSMKPRSSGVYTPNLPAELWAEVLRFAGALVEDESGSGCTSTASATSSDEPTSFLTHRSPHTHLSSRLELYNAGLRWKASLTRVCRMFHWLAQEVLYADVWLGKGQEGRLLAGRLCGDGGVGGWGIVESRVWSGKKKIVEKKKGLFGWLKPKKQPVTVMESTRRPSASTSLVSTCANTSSASSSPFSSTSSTTPMNVGRFIRRLHIETPSMEKCSPHDILIILQYCPRLEEYVDYRSVRRPMHPLALSASPVAPFSSYSASASASSSSPLATPPTPSLLTTDALLHTLLSRPLKTLSWTNYDHDPADFARGVAFYEDVVGPRLAMPGVGTALEALEITLSWRGVMMGSGGAGIEDGIWGVGTGEVSGNNAVEVVPPSPQTTAPNGVARTRPPPLTLSAPLSIGINAALLTEASFTTTTTMFSSASSSFPSTPISPSFSQSIDGTPYTLLLPALRSLKLTLDNATFAVLSRWDMPRLSHLCVSSVSSDFINDNEHNNVVGVTQEENGFTLFFEVHGWKISVLELGNDDNAGVEEAWVVGRPSAPPSPHPNANGVHPHPTTQTSPRANTPLPLPSYTPNLTHFICSADAEWNWLSPDWIAPHVLLPAHANLEFIGVRGLERRLKGDVGLVGRRMLGGGVRGRGEERDDEDDPYFMLLEQFTSLLRTEAFPSLRVVRDMSWESDVMRRSGRLGSELASGATFLFSPAPASSSSSVPPTPSYATNTNTPHVLIKPRKSFSSSPPPSSPTFSSLSPSSALATTKRSKPHSKTKSPNMTREHGQHTGRVHRFWSAVGEKCAERGVRLEDYRGGVVCVGKGKV